MPSPAPTRPLPMPRTFLRPLDWPRARLLWISLPALAVVLVGAVLLAATGNHPPFQSFDDAWYHLMLDSRTPWLTSANRVLDFTGNAGMVIYCVALFLVLLPRHRRLALFTATANLAVLGATHLLKVIVSRPRPEDQLVQVDSGSYPSGHTSATFAAMLVTAIVLGRAWMWISGAILSVAMMFSRTYLGAHWASDTVAGALLAVGLVVLLWALVQDKCRQGNVPPG